MAGIDVGGGHGGKKSVNQEIPLVPFIDFLLCCVMFLLVTAVWNQLARIETNSSISGRPIVGAEDPPEPRRLLVTASGYSLYVGGAPAQTIAKNGQSYDRVELGLRLAMLRDAEPNRRDLVLEADDGIAYADIVDAMDTTASSGLTNFSLSPLPLGPR